MNRNPLLTKIVNVLFHPLLSPLYVMAIFYFCVIIIRYLIPSDKMLLIASFVLITAVIIPLICKLLFKKMKIYKQFIEQKIHIDSFLSIFMATIYFAIYKSFTNIGVSEILSKFFILNSLMLLCLSLASLFTKVDFHSIAIGEMLGLYIRLLHIGSTYNYWVFLILLFVAGIVGWARIKTNEDFAFKYHLGIIIGGLFFFFLYV